MSKNNQVINILVEDTSITLQVLGSDGSYQHRYCSDKEPPAMCASADIFRVVMAKQRGLRGIASELEENELDERPSDGANEILECEALLDVQSIYDVIKWGGYSGRASVKALADLVGFLASENIRSNDHAVN